LKDEELPCLVNPPVMLDLRQSQTQSVAFGILLGFFLICARTLFGRTRNKYLPPGPKGIPFFGNFLQLSKGKAWKVFEEWGKDYGEFLLSRWDLSTLIQTMDRSYRVYRDVWPRNAGAEFTQGRI
jgi:hypothetical protein